MRREIRPEQFLVRLSLFAGLGAAELERLAAGGLIEVRGRTVEIPDLARLRAWSKA